MSVIVMKYVCDADQCEILGVVTYSTNPREYVTVGEMVEMYDNAVSERGWE